MIAWTTDLHLTFQLEEQKQLLIAEAQKYDGLIVCGDISEGRDIKDQLEWLNEIGVQVYFVLGNHDFYHSSFRNTQDFVHSICKENLHYLTTADPIKLGEYTLIGHDAWYDCRLGNISGRVILRDFDEVQELKMSKGFWGGGINDLLIAQCKDKADEGTEQLIKKIEKIDGKIILVVHAPPYFEACYFDGRATSDEFIPFYCNHNLGEQLNKMKNEIIVLCGHTHHKAKFVKNNITTLVGEGSYYYMGIDGVIDES